MSTTTLYSRVDQAPAHEHGLWYAPRPLPGRLVGRSGGMVFDIAPEYVELAKRDDAASITLVTVEEFEALVAEAVAGDGRYTRADYEAADAWDADSIGRRFGMVMITIKAEEA